MSYLAELWRAFWTVVRSPYSFWGALGDDPSRETAADRDGCRPRDMRMVDGEWKPKE